MYSQPGRRFAANVPMAYCWQLRSSGHGLKSFKRSCSLASLPVRLLKGFIDMGTSYREGRKVQ